MNDALFSSATDEWATPQSLFDRLNAIFAFGLDVCATPENAKCARFFTRAEDGLAQPWTGSVWMNPPYGRTIGAWMAKAAASARAGATVVCLVPARTDTAWWQDNVESEASGRHPWTADICFLRGRVKFGDAPHSAPFPSAVIVFMPPAVPVAAQREST